ncbi:MAG: hypothetical protein JSU83_00125 [Deltaproteobacteria bacterium]|nr:MAG: hypothetical protein JSU83_00125 [Deltaproteobacteria bacterium]
MKNKLFFIFSLSMMLLSLVPRFEFHASAKDQLPLQITEFYDDFNFVSAFSTPEERAALQYLSRLAPDKRPHKKLTDRLKRVQEIAQKIEKNIWQADPGISLRTQLPEKIQPAKLVAIRKFHLKKDRVSVWVNIFHIHLQLNTILVSEYEKNSGRNNSPSIQEQLERVQTEMPQTEIHHWLKINGRWLLDAARILLLE